MAKRVLFISPQPYFQWRGSPIRVAFDTQALAEGGYDVDLLTLPFGEDRDVPGVRVLRVPNPLRLRGVKIGPSAAKLLFDVLLLLKGMGLCFRHRYDMIHGVEDAGMVAWVLCASTRARFVFEKHSDPSSYRQGGLRNVVMAVYGAVERFLVRRAAATIGTGPGLADQARAAGGRGVVRHIPDIPSSLVSADDTESARQRASFQRTPEDRLVMYVGSFAVYQGVDLLFDAVPHAVEAFPQARFVIIGGSVREIEERRAALRDAGCDDAVVFTGKVPPDELPHVLAAADVLLSPRLCGVNTPLKILDYMKAGRAIVATDTPANRLLLDETRAFMAEAQPAAYARAIADACADDAKRDAMAAQGLELVNTTYSFAAFKSGLLNCYEAALKP